MKRDRVFQLVLSTSGENIFNLSQQLNSLKCRRQTLKGWMSLQFNLFATALHLVWVLCNLWSQWQSVIPASGYAPLLRYTTDTFDGCFALWTNLILMYWMSWTKKKKKKNSSTFCAKRRDQSPYPFWSQISKAYQHNSMILAPIFDPNINVFDKTKVRLIICTFPVPSAESNYKGFWTENVNVSFSSHINMLCKKAEMIRICVAKVWLRLRTSLYAQHTV